MGRLPSLLVVLGLFIACQGAREVDTDNHRIRRIAPDGVGPHDCRTGARGFAVDTAGNVHHGIAVDGDSLYIADGFDDRCTGLSWRMRSDRVTRRNRGLTGGGPLL